MNVFKRIIEGYKQYRFNLGVTVGILTLYVVYRLVSTPIYSFVLAYTVMDVIMAYRAGKEYLEVNNHG